MSKYLSYSGLQKLWAKIKSLFLPLSGGTMANTNKVVNLNADLLDGYHSSTFSHRIKFSESSTAKWFKIRININYGCMFSITIKVAGGYTHRVINIGGYNYSTNKGWYSPTAFCLGASGALSGVNSKVIFGKDGDGEIWFAVHANGYNSVEVVNAQFYWSATPGDLSNAFTCTLIDPSTVTEDTYAELGTVINSIVTLSRPMSESSMEEIATTWINSNCI